MSALVHYLTGPGSVACDMPWSVVSTVTENWAVVTCNDCRQAGTPVPPPATDVRPSPRAKLRQVRQVLAEWVEGVHDDAETLSIITGIIDKEEPDDGRD